MPEYLLLGDQLLFNRLNNIVCNLVHYSFANLSIKNHFHLFDNLVIELLNFNSRYKLRR
jgi:hypothetical protein